MKDEISGMMPLNGKWIWKDETNTLEYVSNNPIDRHDKRKKKKKAADADGRASPNQAKAGNYAIVKDKLGIRGTVGQRVVGGRTHHHNDVKIQDIKIVACDMTGEENLSEYFNGLYETEQFDHFLLCLINYFHWFFERLAQDEKPNPMNIEPSRSEVQLYNNLLKKMEIAQKVLGQSYCILVLGEGIANQHHMECGLSRVSNTYKDRSMYETLYTFCSYVVWIAFRRNKDYEAVKKELNKILRSDTFNPAIRIKNAPDEEKEDADPELARLKAEQERQMTPAEYRRKHGRRPPIKSVITQRSPALVSILPTPKEEAPWLFKCKGKDAMNQVAKSNREDLDASEDPDKFAHLYMEQKDMKMGIIGEPLKLFNSITLTPKGTGLEDGEEEETKSEERRPSGIGTSERKMSREATATSITTQDGLPDDA